MLILLCIIILTVITNFEIYIAVIYACINTHYLKKYLVHKKIRTASNNVNSNSKKIWVRREWILPSLFLFPWLQGLLLKRLRIFESFKNNQLGTCAPSFTQRPDTAIYLVMFFNGQHKIKSRRPLCVELTWHFCQFTSSKKWASEWAVVSENRSSFAD